MKQFKKISSFILAFLLCLTAFLGTPMAASAEEGPTTYYLKYVPASNEWRFQIGTWDPNGYHRELYYVYQDIKDGDLLVIDDTENAGIDLHLDVQLSNLTIVHGEYIIVTTKGIDDFYCLNNSTCAINADVTNAYVYDAGVCNFNKNVSKLELLSEKNDLLSATIAVVGTLDHVIASGKSYLHFEHYNFKENTFYMEKGTLKTDASNYSKTPVTPETTSTPATPDDEYDEVPKTADIRFNPLWLVGIAALCFAGSYKLRSAK